MALLHADSISQYADPANMLEGIYANAATYISNSPDPLDGGRKVLRMWTNANNRWILPVPRTTVGMGARIWIDSMYGSNDFAKPVFGLNGPSNGQQCGFRISTSAEIQLMVGSTVVATSAPAVITAAAFHHVEFKGVIHNVNGYMEVRINGIPVINWTGDTQNHATETTCGSVIFSTGQDGGGPNVYLKDLVVWDDQGARNNDWMGTVSVFPIKVTADSSLNWATSSGASGSALIDEAVSDDADYIYAVTPPPAASKFALGDLPADITSVRGIVTFTRARKTDGGDANLQIGLVNGANTVLGADRPITTAFTFWRDVFETAPDGVTWTKAKFDATEFQINRTL